MTLRKQAGSRGGHEEVANWELPERRNPMSRRVTLITLILTRLGVPAAVAPAAAKGVWRRASILLIQRERRSPVTASPDHHPEFMGALMLKGLRIIFAATLACIVGVGWVSTATAASDPRFTTLTVNGE